ncbi:MULTISPECIES: lactate utilization protein C [Paenibacillus]|uniref:LutC/YkgG family protein n=1 Tax=Paenibacillus TaxID=44249 RepID=UPI002FDFFDB0
MAEGHREWLDHLNQRSRAKQEEFLGKIASRLQRPRLTEKPRQPYRGAPEFWNRYEGSEDDNIQLFTRNFEAAGGDVIRADSLQDAGRFMTEKALELKAKRILRHDRPALAELGLESSLPEAEVHVWNRGSSRDWKARAAEADIGIVLADYAVAYTGSIAVLSGPEKGRSVSLLPMLLFTVIPVSSLVTRLGEVLTEFDRVGREGLPAGIHFISGPSRSADIENDLTIGVHGPGVVYAVLVSG